MSVTFSWAKGRQEPESCGTEMWQILQNILGHTHYRNAFYDHHENVIKHFLWCVIVLYHSTGPTFKADTPLSISWHFFF